MNKKTSRLLKGVVIVLMILTLLAPAIVSNAFTSSQSNSSTILDIVANRQNNIKQYGSFVNELSTFTKGMDNSLNLSESKIQLIDEILALRNKYSSSPIVSTVSSQLLNTITTSSSTNISDLLNSIDLNLLLNSKNLAIESLTPDVEIDNMVATTAGKLSGSDYQVKLAGKIYYANTDSSGKPTSNKWAILVHGNNMDGQSIADAIGQMYLDQNINVLAPDLRGCGNSEGSCGMGYLESLDIWDWLTYLNTNYSGKCDEIFVHGVSLGGATTLFLSGLEIDGKTLKDQKVIGLVEDCGYTSLTGIVKDLLGSILGGSSSSSDTNSSIQFALKSLGLSSKMDLSSLNIDNLSETLVKQLLLVSSTTGLTESNFDEKQNALNSLTNCNLPLLIIHGTKDPMVPFKNSDTIYANAMANTNIPYVQRYSVEGETHAFIVLGSKYNVYEGHVQNFIKQSEEINSGKSVQKQSDYVEEKEEKTSVIDSLIKALKLIKNQIIK